MPWEEWTTRCQREELRTAGGVEDSGMDESRTTGGFEDSGGDEDSGRSGGQWEELMTSGDTKKG